MDTRATQSPPPRMQQTQEWFAGIITTPLGKKDLIRNRSPHGTLIAEEASQYVVPSPTLLPHERMQIYNQQYWWRLLNTLHANFPLVTRFFGRHAFNETIGIPFLLKHPPNHWSLNHLGTHLPQWIRECYKKPDRSLVLNAALLDWAFMDSLITSHYPPLDISGMIEKNPDSLLSTPFYLQPHINLYSWEYDLFTFRETFLSQDFDYWVNHRFPKLPKGKTFYFVLYRTSNNNIGWKEISKGEFTLLERFKTGSTMADACSYIETKETTLQEEAAENLQLWLQEWTQAAWLTATPT